MSRLDRVREQLDEHGHGMLVDLTFAVAWVAMVTLVFDLTDGPTWAYYLWMLAGIPAYLGFVYSLAQARATRPSRESS